MHAPIAQDAVDQRINQFLSRKTAWKTAGKLFAEHLTPSNTTASTDSDISYEPLEWRHSETVRGVAWQKAR